MYEEPFENGLERLDRRDAVRRAFALNVAVTLGDEHPDEYERIRADANWACDRTILKLAFHEGRWAASSPEYLGSTPAAR